MDSFVCIDTGETDSLAVPTGPAPGVTPRQVATAVLNYGGYGYTAGDVLAIYGGNGVLTESTITVSTVNADGAITAISLTTGGDFTTDPPTPNAPQGGSGIGAIVDLTFSATGGPDLVLSDALLHANINPKYFGQSVTFQVGPDVSLIDGETVTFKDGATTLATRSISGNQATFITSSLLVGTHSINAFYNFDSSTIGTIEFRVGKAISVVQLSSAANPAVFGQSVTFTSTISALSPGGGTPSGSSDFLDSEDVLGSGTLSSGQVTFTPNPGDLDVRRHCMRSNYGGDANFTRGGTPTGLNQQINKCSSGVAVGADVLVFPIAPGSGIPSGTITFTLASVVLGTETLDGSGHCPLTFSAPGTIISYGGDANFNPSSHAPL